MLQQQRADTRRRDSERVDLQASLRQVEEYCDRTGLHLEVTRRPHRGGIESGWKAELKKEYGGSLNQIAVDLNDGQTILQDGVSGVGNTPEEAVCCLAFLLDRFRQIGFSTVCHYTGRVEEFKLINND